MDVYVARQPIFDRGGEVSGYELLYRRSAESYYADGTDVNQMSRDVVIQSFLEVGLDKITRGKASYINFGREMLLGGSYELLNPESIVIELLEEVKPDAEVIAACRRLVKGGYRLALDDYVPGGPHEVLLPYASIVKVDVLDYPPPVLAGAVASLRNRGIRMLAEKVETAEIHDECRQMGFEFFQGYFYARPEIVANRGVSVEQATIVKLMNLLGKEAATDHDIEEGFRRDPSLSYKLLRIVNNAAQGVRGVESIRFAISLLGRETLKRWLALLLASSFAAGGGADLELVHSAVLRARFCELLGARTQPGSAPDALFLVGLVSLMDALLRTPMEEVIRRVNLAAPVRTALLHREGPYAQFLRIAEAYEAGDWETVQTQAPAVGLSPDSIPQIYLEAAEWARQQVGDSG